MKGGGILKPTGIKEMIICNWGWINTMLLPFELTKLDLRGLQQSSRHWGLMPIVCYKGRFEEGWCE